MNRKIQNKKRERFVNKNSSKPVVFAGGLFSNLFRWEENNGLAKQMIQEGRDSWEIEITGGPGQDCDTCVNYKYEDLTDYYWPALISGVMEYSGENKIDYVGHSNGCRSALDSLKNWSSTGKNNSGYYFDVSTGNYLLMDLPSNPVDTFVGLGCPGTFNGSSRFIIKSLEKGDLSIQIFQQQNKLHISNHDHAKIIDPTLNVFLGSGEKISLNLILFYNDIATQNSDKEPGNSLSINKLYLIAGSDGIFEAGNNNGHDTIVPLNDLFGINAGINSSENELEVYPLRHDQLIENAEVIRYVKSKLR